MKQMMLCLVLLFGVGYVHAQVINPPPGSEGETDTTEWRGWSGISMGFKPVKSLSIVWSQQWRWDNDFSSFDRSLQQISCGWSPRWNKFSKAQSLGLALRHTTRPDRKGDVQGNDRFLRWQVEHGAEFDAGRWAFETRIRFQNQQVLALKDGSDPTQEGASKQWRFKGEVGYNIKGFKWDPDFAVERFVAVVPSGWVPDGAWRMRLGTSTKLGKQHKLRVFLQRDVEAPYSPAPPGMTLFEVGAGLDDLRQTGGVEWTVGLQWRYRIKFKKKKSPQGDDISS